MAETFTNIPGGGGSLIVATFASLPASAKDGTIATTADTGLIYVFTGGSWQLRGTNGASGVLQINGDTTASQTLSNGTTGTAPAWVNNGTGDHKLNIPLASGVGVTSGTLSKAQYDALVAGITFPLLSPSGPTFSKGYLFAETGNDTGMTSPSDGVIDWYTNAALSMHLETAGLTVYGPITTSNIIYPAQPANTFLAGPTSGSPDIPTFRTLGTGEIPSSALSWPLLAPEGAGFTSGYLFGESGNDTGMASPSDGTIDWYTNSVLMMELVNGLLTVNGNANFTGNISAANYPPTDNANTFAGFNGSGVLESIPGFQIDTTTGGMDINLTYQPNGGSPVNIQNTIINYDPLQNSPSVNTAINAVSVFFDVNNSGFSQGTTSLNSLYFGHNNTGTIGGLEFLRMGLNLGNGTDPLTVNGGLSGVLLVGNISANTTMISGQIQGYNFGVSANAAAIINQNVIGFLDSANFACSVDGYVSAQLSPVVAEITNNHNFNSLNINPQIATFTGNAGFFGMNMSPALGTLDTGFVSMFNSNPNITLMGNGNMISVNPSIAMATGNVNGIDIDMSNTTVFAGVQSSLVIQDLTLTINQVGNNDNITIEYVNDGTAGAETVNFSYPAFVVHMQSGVSTATQIKAALDGSSAFSTNASSVISGVGSNAQVTQAPTNFAGGINAGTKRAARFNGDVQIQGALSFTGALSIGQLNSFAPVTMTSGGGVTSIDTLITQLNVPASATITGTDVLGVNTASLINIGNGASVTTSFLGVTALGLPAVLSMGTGSTIDSVSGATFALSLDSGATGGTVDNVYLCRALAIPNGVTTVNKLFGYEMDLPFGAVGTQAWGVYIAPDIPNWMQGSLVLGGTPLSVPANSDVALQIRSKKSLMLGSLTTAEISGLTALEGMMVFDNVLKKFQGYDGTSWVNLN